jgi:hypothetical protein
MRAFGTAQYTTYLEGGIYRRNRILELTNKDDQNKTWAAYMGQKPILDGGRNTATGISIGVPGLVIRGITLRNFARSGIFAKYCSHLLLDGNTILHITTPDWRTNILGSSIFLLHVRKSVVINNLVDGNTATGIQINGGSTRDDNSDDVVSHNRVYNTCTAVNDCGAIYFRDLGHISSGQKILDNVVANFGTRANEHAALYLDDEASNVIVAGNIIYGSGTYALLIHGGDHNVIHNNIFDISEIDRLGLYQDDVGSGNPNYGMMDNRFSGNVIYSGSMPPDQLWDYIDQTDGAIAPPIVFNNIYYDPRSPLRNTGAIVDHSPIDADPLFIDPAYHDYRTHSGSPVRKFDPQAIK